MEQAIVEHIDVKGNQNVIQWSTSGLSVSHGGVARNIAHYWASTSQRTFKCCGDDDEGEKFWKAQTYRRSDRRGNSFQKGFYR